MGVTERFAFGKKLRLRGATWDITSFLRYGYR